MTAAARGDEAAVRRLLDKGMSPNQSGFDGITPLLLASEQGHLRVVKTLLAGGAKHSPETGRERWTPLIVAAGHGRYAVVEALLTAGANVNQRNAAGATPLIWAAAYGHASIVKLLLTKRADTSLRDVRGRTAMMFAQVSALGDAKGRKEVLKLLQQAGKNR